MSSGTESTKEAPKEKNLFWTVRVANAMPDWRSFLKNERSQYRTDVTALLCRGNLSDSESQRIKLGLNVEKAMFWASRALVPLCLFVMFRRGVFQESFHIEEVRSIIKIGVSMHLMDLTGHGMMRLLTKPIVEEHIGLNEMSFASQKKTVDDYLVQKNYFKSKKENKL